VYALFPVAIARGLGVVAWEGEPRRGFARK